MKTRFALIAALLLTILVQLSICFAQNTMMTYQGRVLDNGTNFSGIGKFKFALVTSSNANRTATATANPPSGGFITGYIVTSGGNGYINPPAVTVFGGGGSGASAHANISGGVVTSLSVDNPGNGNYTNMPTVLIAPPPANFSYTTYWSNDGTSANGSPPIATVSVNVSNGLFTVVLGDAAQAMEPIPATIFAQPNLELRIWFNDGVNGFAALDPPQNLTPAPYAVFANTASHVSGLSIRQNTNDAPNVILGSSGNHISNGVIGATIAGGGTAFDDFEGRPATNSVTANFGTVSGGDANTASGVYATVSGGFNNTAIGQQATVSGGIQNLANAVFATVGGGWVNTASGRSATVPGGEGNTASGYASFAAGQGAQALHNGAFVWADADIFAGLFSSTTTNQFSIRAAGGLRFAGDVSLEGGASYHRLGLSGGNAFGYLYGSYPAFGDGIHLGYNFYADANGVSRVSNPGGPTSRITVGYGEIRMAVGGINAAPNTTMLYINSGGVCANGPIGNCSDRNVKQDFTPVSPAEILEKVSRLPLSAWSYKNTPAVRHVGPMAQDFYSAFNLGGDDKYIATVDADGIALAAIQGLNQKVEAQRAENAELKRELVDLKKLVGKLVEQR
jgi:hypothetical protein